MAAQTTTVLIGESLAALAAGDDGARHRLVELSAGRLRQIAHQLLTRDRVRRFEETDDVVQEASMRIHRELELVRPVSAREFLSFSAFHIRRCLCEMARKHFRANLHIGLGLDADRDVLASSQATNPAMLAIEAERRVVVLEQVDALPDIEREITEMIWMHGLSQEEVADVLGMSVRSVRRHWRSARLRLARRLKVEA